MDKEMELTSEEMEELEAASDTSENEEEDIFDINDKLSYVVKLSKEYDLNGEKIREVDLSGLEDLTTQDAEYIDRVMNRMKHHPANKFSDITYTKHVAMRVTNLPIEFFNALKWKDQQAITSRIAIYFLY